MINSDTANACFVSAIYLVLVATSVHFNYLSWLILPIIIVSSTYSFLLHGMDKKAAASEQWRVPESKFYLFALIGGWPGSLIGQHVFRNKTQKKKYQNNFMFFIFINVIAVIWVIYPTS